MITVGIVGFGRFGNLLKSILDSDHQVLTFDQGDSYERLADCEYVFLCVPIRALEPVLAQIAPHLGAKTTVIDTCSVKCYPVACMQQALPTSTPIIATHPLFGPDSYGEEYANRIMMHAVRDAAAGYAYWQGYFNDKGIETIELTPDEHDRFAARSQGITHLLGRVLQTMQIKPTPIDTLGFERLLGIMNQTCNDSWELFNDLQHYNPYTQSLVDEITTGLAQVTEHHLPAVTDPKATG